MRGVGDFLIIIVGKLVGRVVYGTLGSRSRIIILIISVVILLVFRGGRLVVRVYDSSSPSASDSNVVPATTMMMLMMLLRRMVVRIERSSSRGRGVNCGSERTLRMDGE